jgi:hypothetical protein
LGFWNSSSARVPPGNAINATMAIKTPVADFRIMGVRP